ncbi:MAG: hypothetical protein JWN44_4600 [Myxococcales bacterium]|nr:hypothetical protein [Myxococcales bacterium]
MAAATDHDLDDSRPLPWTPGEGPFRIKGVAYRGHLAYVAEHVPGGVEEMLAGFKDRRIAEFFQQKFLASTFYDIAPLVIAGYVCARQCRRTFFDFVKVRSRYQAQQDIGGIYRMLLKLTSPATVAVRLPAVSSQYLDFPGDAKAELIDKQHAVLSRTELPLMLKTWFTLVYETYVDVTLTAAGGRSVLSRTSYEPDQPLRGYETVKFRCEVSWQ